MGSEEAQARLVALGAAAVPALVATLDDEARGWIAAMVLSKIGAPGAAAASDALLSQVVRGGLVDGHG